MTTFRRLIALTLSLSLITGPAWAADLSWASNSYRCSFPALFVSQALADSLNTSNHPLLGSSGRAEELREANDLKNLHLSPHAETRMSALKQLLRESLITTMLLSAEDLSLLFRDPKRAYFALQRKLIFNPNIDRAQFWRSVKKIARVKIGDHSNGAKGSGDRATRAVEVVIPDAHPVYRGPFSEPPIGQIVNWGNKNIKSQPALIVDMRISKEDPEYLDVVVQFTNQSTPVTVRGTAYQILHKYIEGMTADEAVTVWEMVRNGFVPKFKAPAIMTVRVPSSLNATALEVLALILHPQWVNLAQLTQQVSYNSPNTLYRALETLLEAHLIERRGIFKAEWRRLLPEKFEGPL